MTYRLKFIPSALKEWKKLDPVLQKQFKKKLTERIQNPEVAADRLRGEKNFYKIKLRQSGYRLLYEVDQGGVVIWVLGAGKRNRSEVYTTAMKRNRPSNRDS
jgi:mRNA interferase RelE/StbE